MKMKLSLLAASAILAVGMTGCWTESTPTAAQAAYVAKAIDGYIKNPSGCFDVNKNGVCDDAVDIPFATTDGTSNINISADNAKYPYIITGGVDEDTNATFTGVLQAPAGSKVATPLTTLLAYGVMTEAQITTLLGLPAGTDLKSDYRGTSFNASIAKAAATIQALLSQTSAIFAADKSLTAADIMNKTVAALLTTMATPADLKDTTKLTTLIQAIDTKLNSKVDTSNVTTLVSNIASSVTAVQSKDTATFTEASAAEVTRNIVENSQNNSGNSVVITTPLSKAVTIANNTFTVSDKNATFGQNGAFTSTVSTSASATTIGFTLQNNGGELNATAKPIGVAIFIDDKANSRQLKAILSGATIVGDSNTSTITVPKDAVLYVQGIDSKGTSVAVDLTDNTTDIFTSAAGVTTFNLTNILSRIEAKSVGSKFANINQIGSYAISFYVSGLQLGFAGATISELTAPTETITATTASGTKTLSGTKFVGNLTVTK